MSLDYVKFSSGFEKFMPKEYRDMVEHGPFGKKVSVSQMGSFKEVLEEHPMCAGCAMTLFIRLAMIAFPNPEDTITVGTAGCGRLAISQAAIPFVYGNYGDQNGVASGLSRGLRLRFGDKPKDVVVMAGDGGTADIGFQQVLHSWFRKERFTTIMLDNEVWSTQKRIARIYGRSIPTINDHLKKIYNEKELLKALTERELVITQIEGKKKVSRKVFVYSTDVLIAIGFRVNGEWGREFRMWAREIVRKSYNPEEQVKHLVKRN